MKRERLHLIFISWLMLYLPFTHAFSQQWEYIGLKGIDITSIVPHPTDNRILYLVGNYKIFKTVDGGASWDTLKTGFLVETGHLAPIKDMAISPSNPDVLYAIWVPIEPRIFKSTDGGSTWFRIGQGYSNFDSDAILNTIAVDPDSCHIVYLGLGGFSPGEFLKSEDGGQTWYMTWYGPGVLSIAIDPITPNILYAGPQMSGPVRKSYDRGESWVNTGFYTASGGVLLIRIDPFNAHKIYLVAIHQGLFVSVDSGATWSKSDLSKIITSGYFYIDLLFDPVRRGLSYMAANGKVYQSANQAESWSELSSGLDSTSEIGTLAITPDGSILYCGGNGLYRYVLKTRVEENDQSETTKVFFCLNYPNPFNSTTRIEYSVPHAERIHLSVYSLDGRQVISRCIKSGGTNYGFFTLDCSHLSSGVYIYVIEAKGVDVLGGKMTVLK